MKTVLVLLYRLCQALTPSALDSPVDVLRPAQPLWSSRLYLCQPGIRTRAEYSVGIAAAPTNSCSYIIVFMI